MATTETMKKSKMVIIPREKNPLRAFMPYELARQDDLDALERRKKLTEYGETMKKDQEEKLKKKGEDLIEKRKADLAAKKAKEPIVEEKKAAPAPEAKKAEVPFKKKS